MHLAQIWTATSAKSPVNHHSSADLEKHRGIVGDRYHSRTGSFSTFEHSGRPITLISFEALIAVHKEHGLDLLAHGLHRRNLVISDCASLDLTELMNQRFQIGTAILMGMQPAHPCRFLEKTAPPGTYDALQHCGGIRADVLKDGTINCGDAIQLLGTPRRLP